VTRVGSLLYTQPSDGLSEPPEKSATGSMTTFVLGHDLTGAGPKACKVGWCLCDRRVAVKAWLW
jgi:hypothetical protein